MVGLKYRGVEIGSASEMVKRVYVLLFIFLLLFVGFSSASATTSPASECEKKKKNKSPICFFIFSGFFSPVHFSAETTHFIAELVTGFFSNALSALMKWLWSLPTTSKTGEISKFPVNFFHFSF